MVCEFPILLPGARTELVQQIGHRGRPHPGPGCWTLTNLITPGAISGWNLCTGSVVQPTKYVFMFQVSIASCR